MTFSKNRQQRILKIDETFHINRRNRVCQIWEH